jgi:dTDP-4-dehydrorhamnose 3,5-epimerase
VADFEPDSNFGGIWTRRVNTYFDLRGSFREILRKSDLPLGTPQMLQESISISRENVLRGMHYQEGQWQVVTLIKGAIQDIILCVDENSDNYLKSSSRYMDDKELNQILIAPGLAHGFANLGKEAIIHYSSSVYFGATTQHGIHWESKPIKDLWEHRNWIVSERDLEFSLVEAR